MNTNTENPSQQAEWTVTELGTRAPARAAFAGLGGAAALMVYHAFADLLSGPFLYTPSLMGSALFRGEVPAAAAGAQLEMVAAYTALHVGAFVGLAYLTVMLQRNFKGVLPSGFALVGLTAVAVFFTLEAYMIGMATVIEPALFDLLSRADVAIGNAIAALVVAGGLHVQRA
jgi:hypothetical protein